MVASSALALVKTPMRLAALVLMLVVGVTGYEVGSSWARGSYSSPVPLQPADGAVFTNGVPVFAAQMDMDGGYPDRFAFADVGLSPALNQYGGFAEFLDSCLMDVTAPATTYGQLSTLACRLDKTLPLGTYYWMFQYQHADYTAATFPNSPSWDYHQHNLGPFKFTIVQPAPSTTTTPTTTSPSAPNASGCRVPNVRGMTVPGARARLFRMNCEVGRITRTRSKVIRRGRVIAQSPAAGTRSKAGARVRLLVSLGR